MPVPELADSSRPIVGLCIAPRPEDALGLRRLALLCDIALTCVPFVDPAEPFRGLAGERPDAMFLLVASTGAAAAEALGQAVDLFRPTPVIAVFLPPGSPADRAQAIRAGVGDALDLEASPEEFSLRVRNAVGARRLADYRGDLVSGYEREIRGTIGEILLREYEALYILGKASEYRDQETGAHVGRVARYSRLIAHMIGQDEASQETVYHASALHDIGKLSVPDSILLKPGRLDEEETAVMRLHTTNGQRMLESSRSSYLLTGALISLTHHERYDGSGYPMGIGGDDIPLVGRIVGIADVFDALTSRRPYKEAWPLDEALEYLARERGRQFDPMLVDAFVYNEIHVRSIFDAFPGLADE